VPRKDVSDFVTARFSEGHNKLRPVLTPVEIRDGVKDASVRHCTEVSAVVFFSFDGGEDD